MIGGCCQMLLLAVLLSCSKNGPTEAAAGLCPKGRGAFQLLVAAGISTKSASVYATIMRQNSIDEAVLGSITLQQLKDIGIAALGDRLKIHKFFSDDGDNCANSSCKNGGICRDGFRCFGCSCDGGFYGPTCEKKCPCKNNAKCKTTVTGFKCECTPGYTGILCEKQWLNEDRFKQLEQLLVELTTRLNRSEERLKASERQVAEQRRILAEVQKKQNASGWRMVRVNEELNKLNKMKLNGVTPTYIQKIPLCLPRNTKAILISVFTYFWNSGGHAYLDFKTHQKGNEKNGSVAVKNEHYNIYANTFYYELMLPWDTALPDELVFVVTRSALDGGDNNWYRIKLVGYITA
nr:neurogenic locus notch-like protein 3 [Haliclona caerulea]